MIINKRVFQKNVNFILATIIVIILLFLIYLFTNKNYEIKESELSESGVEEYTKLVINEYMSSNDALIDEEGNSYDWVELYNGNEKDINLKNYGLSDQDDRIKWVFPDVTIKAKSYLIVYLSGKNQDGLYATFKLKSTGGETIALVKPSGKVIDAIKTIALEKGRSSARDLSGNWIITDMPTPNYPNTKEGYNNLYESRKVENNGIKINEILPKNSGNFSVNNKFYGYVEIINTSDAEIDLSSYYLSNDLNKLYKYRMENIKIKPNEIITVYMGIGNDGIHSGFNLDSKDGTIYISNNYGIVDEVTYEGLPNGFAYVRIGDNFEETSIISPGYPNTNDGVRDFYKKYKNNNKTLLINEVMSNNNSYLAQNGYKFYDWIELYNNSDQTINLSEYTLTTTTNNIKMFTLPNVELRPHTYYVLMASGDTNLSNTYMHTNFKISDVESLYLYKNKEVIDSVMISNIPLNYSYGRGSSYGFYYIDTPTPLKENKVGTQDISYAPTFSKNGGVYNDVDVIRVELASYGNIYYTLDGSTPSTSSIKYTGPIDLKKTSVLKAISIENGKLKSTVITNSYIINENHTLPVMSMSLNKNDLNRITWNYYSEIEVAGNVEFYEEDGSFTIPCSISLFGGTARELNKKSYALRFKSAYGANNLNYKVFDNRDTAVYESLVLRSGSQDEAYEEDGNYAVFRDVLGTSLVDDYTNVDVQSYKPIILYVNGQYYGIYFIREKVNDDFIANHYNVDPDKLNLIQGKNEIKNGTGNFYNNVVNYVTSHDMRDDANYEGLKQLVDIENYMDFFIGELYTTNNDIINIRYFSHPDIDNGKMKMVFFDLDYAFYNYNTNGYGDNYYEFLTNPEGMQQRFKVDNTILIQLMKNETFKKEFLERLSYNLKNTWKKENVLNRFNEIYDILYPEMQRNLERWNLSFEEWKKNCELLKHYIEVRQDYLLKQTKSFFNLSNDEYNYYFGGVA